MDMNDVYRLRRKLASNRFLKPRPIPPDNTITCTDRGSEDDDVRPAPPPEGPTLRDLFPPDTGGEG